MFFRVVVPVVVGVEVCEFIVFFGMCLRQLLSCFVSFVVGFVYFCFFGLVTC